MHSPGPWWIARFVEQLAHEQPAIDRELACRLAYVVHAGDPCAADPCAAARNLPALDVETARRCACCAVMQSPPCDLLSDHPHCRCGPDASTARADHGAGSGVLAASGSL